MRKFLTISDTPPQSNSVDENVPADSKTSAAITEVSEQARQLSGFEWIGSTQEKLGPSFFLLCILFVALFNYVPSVQILALLAFVFISSLFKRASPVSTLIWIQMSHTLYPMMLFPMVNSPVFYLLPISLTCWEYYYQWFKLRSIIISFLRVRCPDSVSVQEGAFSNSYNMWIKHYFQHWMCVVTLKYRQCSTIVPRLHCAHKPLGLALPKFGCKQRGCLLPQLVRWPQVSCSSS